jgi:hypothetical protein
VSKLTSEQKAHVEKWLNILENDMHEQGQGYLKILKEGIPYYCCLGVAVEAVCGHQFLDREQVPHTNRVIMGYTLHDKSNKSTMGLFGEDKALLGLDIDITDEETPKLMRLTGLSATACTGIREDVCVQMNDEAQLTFPEIALVFKEMGWNE